MSGIFPAADDGGLPPNVNNPLNPPTAYPPIIQPSGTPALYYGNGCDVRLRPEVLNSLISEIEATRDAAGLPYNPAYQTNLQFATRYLIQRGKMSGGILGGGSDNNFTAMLDPKATGYNDFMTLRLTPLVTNTSAVRVNVDTLGYVPVYRNDGQELAYGDWLANMPIECIYYKGAFFMVGLCRSQIPILKFGTVDGWVRTDGNDSTGDGTENTPQKAFRTIYRAYTAIGARYAPSPLLSINVRLGIPGRYEGCTVGPYGGTVTVLGDEANPIAYEVGPDPASGVSGACLSATAVRMWVRGVSLIGDIASAGWCNLRVISAAQLWIKNVRMEVRQTVPGAFMQSEAAGVISCYGNNYFIGNGYQLSFAWVAAGAQFLGSNQVPNAILNITNTRFTNGGIYSTNLGYFSLPATTVQQSGCIGPQWAVTDNSLIRAGGNVPPGSTTGIIQDHGLFFP